MLLRNLGIIYLATFFFYVDHQALLYLINKPMVTCQIVRWLLLIQEFDFKVVYKPS
jgi:hypothetical protein